MQKYEITFAGHNLVGFDVNKDLEYNEIYNILTSQLAENGFSRD